MSENSAQGQAPRPVRPSAPNSPRPMLKASKAPERKPVPRPPWRDSRDVFLCNPRTEQTAKVEEAFDAQVALLSEIIKPTSYRSGYLRSVNFRGLEPHFQRNTLVTLMYMDRFTAVNTSRTYFQPSARQNESECFEIVYFCHKYEGLANYRYIESLEEVPCQGVGGFGLAVIPSTAKRTDVKEMWAKIALSQFLEATPADIECIVVAQASKINLKRLDELTEAGVPLLFDFSGRTNPSKKIVDPLAGMLKPKEGRDFHDCIFTFDGKLNEHQAASIASDAEANDAQRIFRELVRTAAPDDTYPISPSNEVIKALSYGRETYKITPEDLAAIELNKTQRVGLRKPRKWQMCYAEFTADCLPGSTTEGTLERMHALGTIWCKTLKEAGLSMRLRARSPVMTPGQRRLAAPKELEKTNINYEALQEVGTVLGIDSMVESLYNGVPIDYIL